MRSGRLSPRSIHRFLRLAIARMSDGRSRRERYLIDPGKQTQDEVSLKRDGARHRNTKAISLGRAPIARHAINIDSTFNHLR